MRGHCQILGALRSCVLQTNQFQVSKRLVNFPTTYHKTSNGPSEGAILDEGKNVLHSGVRFPVSGT